MSNSFITQLHVEVPILFTLWVRGKQDHAASCTLALNHLQSMATWLRNELPEEWPQQDGVSTTGSTNSGSSEVQAPTVAIQPPDSAQQTAQWKHALRKQTNSHAEHLQGLFPDETSDSDHLSSVSEGTRRLKLFTNTKNTYTNQRLDALATSLQGKGDQEANQSDVAAKYMDVGQNVLSKIRKASNLELRAVYENSKEDTSLDDLDRNLDYKADSNGSTLTELSQPHDSSIRHADNSIHPSIQEQIQPNTVRFRTPHYTETDHDDVESLAIQDYNLETKPSMSFVGEPLTTSASDSSGRVQVRRDVPFISSRSTQSLTSTPSMNAQPRRRQSTDSVIRPIRPHNVQKKASKNDYTSLQGSVKVKSVSSSIRSTEPDKLDRVFEATNSSAELREVPLKNFEDASIARKNVSFSGSLYELVKLLPENEDSCADLASHDLECIKGLDEMLPNLSVVDLSHNKLQVLEGLPPSVIQANLSFNNLNRISTFPLSFITNLDLSHNSLVDLRGLAQLRVLSSLDVSHNKLSSLEGIQALDCLEHLRVDHNLLKSVNISHAKLESLNANSNELMALRLNTPKLTTLELNDNNLFSFDPVPSVKRLHMRNNNASMDLSGFPYLEFLDYEGNPSINEGDIRPLVVKMNEVKKFNSACLMNCIAARLSTQHIGDITLPLQQLDMTNANLTSIPKWLNRLPNLRSLNLSFNKLEDNSLAKIAEIKSLSNLAIAGNQIREISSVVFWLQKLPNLGALDMRGNPLSQSLYPDIFTLMEGNDYDQLLRLNWNDLVDNWGRKESRKEYFKALSALSLWWLDGLEVDMKHSNKYWNNVMSFGLGKLQPSNKPQSVTVAPSPNSITTLKFSTPQENHPQYKTPSRIYREISSIGTRYGSAEKDDTMSRSVLKPVMETKPINTKHKHETQIASAFIQENNPIDDQVFAKLTADLIVGLYRRELKKHSSPKKSHGGQRKTKSTRV